MKKKQILLSTSQIILLSFFLVIIAGALLLWLPISTRSGVSVSFTDALFTATTATCVTGLVVVPTVSWSFFGQVVILILIQTGGLGMVTIMSGIVIAFQKKLGLGNSLLIQDALNLSSLSGIGKFLKKILIGTLCVEGVGAVFYMTVFVPQFGIRGVWVSIFNAVSAFCNAGMDIVCKNSLIDYASNPIVNTVTCLLIILGGLGFVVWFDVIRVFRQSLIKKRHFFENLSLHSKIVITTTLLLIFVGAALICIFEYNNPRTLGAKCIGEKIGMSIFQSVTTRTAGFATIPQEKMTASSSIVSIVLMFIGGSPVGTAGGIKTVTFAVIILTALSLINVRNDVMVFNRKISSEAVHKCVAVSFISMSIVIISTLLLSFTCDRDFLDILYETVSANATVGLSRNLTPFLTNVGKHIITVTMFFGRVGPISLAVSLIIKKNTQNIVRFPVEEISVG